MTRMLAPFGMAAALFVFAPTALAAPEVVVMSDQAKLVSVSGRPGTVVVGNPSIADVTIQGEHIFVHGRNFGTTNLIVLDRDGKQIANFDVTVTLGGANNVGLYKAGHKFSLVCDPSCETMLQVGDFVDHYKIIGEQMTTKSGFASGFSKDQ